jgi:predicted ATPase/class 3 adenylate cyclase
MITRRVRSDLPTGTVTFLFTDVEGSTNLLRELGAEAYADALAEHRRVVREACAAKGGVEVDTQGDAFFFAFPTAAGAVVAAHAITDALANGQIHLRIGLHTGTPLVTDEGYVGDDVNLAARVAASGHGGQILLSKSARELVDGPSLTDLGEHRLKDIEGAVSIYQLGEKIFPPLKTISNTNLPRPASSFIGRERERDDVVRELREGARLLTLTGPGGSGKTRLALEAAAELVTAYKAGVFWIGLAALREPSLVTETIAQTLGARDGLAGHIGERQMLLLLDNLEQVIEAAPDLSALVAACPNLALLVTSRELLRVQGEVEYSVPPLASSEAVTLFCERSGLEPSDEIAELCSRLDDLPLAVELAAARTRALSVAQILERLSQQLDLLRGGRDAEVRQRTLRATIAWSYDLLSAEEQRVFRALSVFVGGCTLEPAEKVAEADLDTLHSLVEKSLLRFTSERYWMLETIREFALQELMRRDEADDAGERHTAFFLTSAAELLAPVGRPTTDEQRERFIADQANFRAAHSRTLDAGDGARAVLFVRRMGRAAWVAGMPVADWYARALASLAIPGATKEDRAYALVRASYGGYLLGELGQARQLLSEAEALFDELCDQRGLADALRWRSEVEDKAGEYVFAAALAERVAAIGEAIGDDDIAMMGKNWLFNPLFSRAVVDGDRQAAERAYALAEAGLKYETEKSDSSSLERAASLSALAASLFALGEYAKSITTAQRSLRDMPMIETGGALMAPVMVIGFSACAGGEPGHGMQLIAAAMKHNRDEGITLGSLDVVRERLERQTRAALGEEGYEAAVLAGEALSLADTIKLALTPVLFAAHPA